MKTVKQLLHEIDCGEIDIDPLADWVTELRGKNQDYIVCLVESEKETKIGLLPPTEENIKILDKKPVPPEWFAPATYPFAPSTFPFPVTSSNASDKMEFCITIDKT